MDIYSRQWANKGPEKISVPCLLEAVFLLRFDHISPASGCPPNSWICCNHYFCKEASFRGSGTTQFCCFPMWLDLSRTGCRSEYSATCTRNCNVSLKYTFGSDADPTYHIRIIGYSANHTAFFVATITPTAGICPWFLWTPTTRL